jgi:hypothetical protein
MWLSEIGLLVSMEGAAGSDVFLVPKEHFAGETPKHGDEGWWYQVVILCRECRKCNVRKELDGFPPHEWK